ncbi:MAG: geranylgeranyl reductase family protein [Neolewinella sp.]|jgi:geranylgeranyl reductase family protein
MDSIFAFSMPNQESTSISEFDIIVVGAGPGGSTFVHCMAGSGLTIALIDKATFPREKVCGDAIPGTAVRVGKSIQPDFWKGLDALHPVRRARGVSPSGIVMDLEYVTEGYTCSRLDFDDYLVQTAKTYPGLTTYFGLKTKDVVRSEGMHLVTLDNGEQLSARLIIGADGAHSIVARKYTDTKLDRNHHCAAVRAYYRGVEGIGHDRLTVYFLKDYMPGYFWIFPLEDGLFNAGFGMLSRQVSENRIDLRNSLDQIIQEDPQVKQHFENAVQEGKNEGFGLPLGSRNVPRSGDGFMLLGDAAGLVDPVTGEGIGNAMISAELAAISAREAFATNSMDGKLLAAYDRAIIKKFGSNFRIKYWAQLLLADRPWLIEGLLRFKWSSNLIQWVIKKVV